MTMLIGATRIGAFVRHDEVAAANAALHKAGQQVTGRATCAGVFAYLGALRALPLVSEIDQSQ